MSLGDLRRLAVTQTPVNAGAKNFQKRKKERENRQLFGSCLRAEKAMELEGYYDSNCRCCSWNSLKKFEKRGLKEVEETCCHSDSSERPPVNAGNKNSIREK